MKHRNKLIVLLFVLSLVFLYHFLYNSPDDPIYPRPAQWAVSMEREGLPNFHKVSDVLYRGGQPEKQGMEELKKMGIKTIVNLRTSDLDQELMAGYEFNYYHLPMNAFLPIKEKFSRFLEIVSDPALQPVFIHCKHGADRTGAAVALYRIRVQGWTYEDAIAEMVNGGFHFHRIHGHLKGFIKRF